MNIMNISVDPLVLHKVIERSNVVGAPKYNPRFKDLEYTPVSFDSCSELLSTLGPYLNFENSSSSTIGTLNSTDIESPDSTNMMSIYDRTKRLRISSILTCQCQAYSSLVERPLPAEITAIDSNEHVYEPNIWEQVVSIAQLNIANGAPGYRRGLLKSWLLNMSSTGAGIISFCEANDWEEMESTTNVEKNRQIIERIAADAGYRYSHVATFSHVAVPPNLTAVLNELKVDSIHMCSDCRPHPYNIGVISSFRFAVVASYGPPIFQRGLLHLYFEDLDMHMYVVHLHAHSSERREAEARIIVKLLDSLLSENKRVVLTGDFNSLSPLDHKRYEAVGLSEFYNRRDDPVFQVLRSKFCHGPLESDRGLLQEINELQARTNIVPNYIASSQNVSEKYSQKPSLALNYDPIKIFLDSGLFDTCIISCGDSEDCMLLRCAATEPTAFDSEWPQLKDGAKRMDVRLDYIMVSRAILKAAGNTLRSSVQRDLTTNDLSDHYPVVATWKWSH